MTYPNHPPPPPPPPFLPSPPPFAADLSPRQHSSNNNDVDLNPTHKRPRINPPNLPGTNPPRGTGNIFYKTRMCLNFLGNKCSNGDQCTFAHGAKELREPPANWQEIVGRKEANRDYRVKVCKRYANGEDCLYGDSCHFLHKRAEVLSFDAADVDGPRESAAIRIGTDALMIPVSRNWEVSSSFAHGNADLQLPGGQTEQEPVNIISAIRPINTVLIPTSDLQLPGGQTEPEQVNAAIVSPASEHRMKRLDQKWKGPKKLNGIYGDWLGDMSPPLMYPKSTDS